MCLYTALSFQPAKLVQGERKNKYRRAKVDDVRKKKHLSQLSLEEQRLCDFVDAFVCVFDALL